MAAAPAYLLPGMKRFYEERRPITLAKWGALGVARAVSLLVTLWVALTVTVLFF